MSTKQMLFILLGLSLLTHFVFFGYPNQTVFDEVHFGKFISGYYTHEYFFDIHPPLGKLMIAGFGKMFDFQPEFGFAEIGEAFPDKSYLYLRFLPALAGTLFAPVIFLLALQMGFQRRSSFVAGLFILLESSFLIQSRFILLDAFLLLFGFGALACYFAYRNTGRLTFLLGFSILAALSFSVKWTGLSFLALAGLLSIFHAISDRTNWKNNAFRLLMFFTVIPTLLYFAIFAVHFALLTKSGTGDAFMTPEFRKTLQGSNFSNSPDIKPLNGLGKFIELNKEMYHSNQRLTAGHAYSSQWYSWPLMLRPIYYWVDSSTPSMARIYLIGNPVIWWSSTLAMLFFVIITLQKRIWPDKISGVLAGGYLLNLLPFMGITRVMFLYHYLTALVFAVLMLVYMIELFIRNSDSTYRNIVIFATIFFLFFSPLIYGFHLSTAQYEWRTWFKSWI